MRYDRKAYTHFVAVRRKPRKVVTHIVAAQDLCFESGWEYREDANDRRRELKDAGLPSVVYARSGARRLGLDPARSETWCSGPLVSATESG